MTTISGCLRAVLLLQMGPKYKRKNDATWIPLVVMLGKQSLEGVVGEAEVTVLDDVGLVALSSCDAREILRGERRLEFGRRTDS